MQSQPLEFRAWVKHAKKMANVVMMGLGMMLLETEDGHSGSSDLENVIVMQSSGFKDTRSQKVFAGDIVSPMTDPENERRYWEVKHEFGCFWINDAPIYDYAIYNNNHPTYQLEGLEVCGNVYTDRELLG